MYEIVEGILYGILSIEIFPGSGGSALCTFRTCNLVLTWLIYGSGARSAGVRDRPGRAYRTLCDSHISADSIEICIDSHIELIPPHSFRGGSWSVCAFKTCHLNSNLALCRHRNFNDSEVGMLQPSLLQKGSKGLQSKVLIWMETGLRNARWVLSQLANHQESAVTNTPPHRHTTYTPFYPNNCRIPLLLIQ